RNFGNLEGANRTVVGYNPLCGDDVTLHLTVKDNVIENVKFEGVGCAISIGAASLMTEAIKGKTIEEASDLFNDIHDMLTKGTEKDLGKLNVLENVLKYPARVKCAVLSWHTLKAALINDTDTITTE
ncbi:hypothetical protein LCGC14_1534030, partial [marine sediment metagenome]